MKKVLTLIFAIILVTGCELGSSNPIELTAESTINGNVSLGIPKTSGTAESFTQSISQDLNDVIANFSDVKDISITELNYSYTNASGNSNAVIQNATLKINGNTIATVSNINITEQATNGTVFSITDSVIREQLETLFLTNTTVLIEFSGSAVSDEGPINFDVQVRLGLLVTF